MINIHEKRNIGFSLIEIILFLGLATIISSILIDSYKNIKIGKIWNIQSVFSNLIDIEIGTSTFPLEKGIQFFISNEIRNSGVYPSESLYYFSNDIVGKRFCKLPQIKNINITPIIPTYENFQLPNHGNVTSLQILQNNLILGLNSATSSDPDVVILDTSTTLNRVLKFISSLNTGPGLAGLVLQGHYLYLANTSVNGQFQIVDISNINNPTLLYSLKIPGSLSSNSKKNPIISSISSNDLGQIFLGSQKSDLGEVFQANFDGNNLSYTNSYNTSSIVNDLYADENGLWVTSPSDIELFHYNASEAIDYVLNALGQSGNGKRIEMFGTKFKILGRTFGKDELVQVEGITKKINATVDDLLVATDSSGNFYVLILASSGGTSQFQIWNTILETKMGNYGLTQTISLGEKINSIDFTYITNRIACGLDQLYIGTASSTVPLVIININKL